MQPGEVTITTTTPSPTACNVLMCASVVGMFLHSVHFGWVRIAGSRGLAAFEEVVALHGVPSYIEVKGSGGKPQPIPLCLHSAEQLDLSFATVSIVVCGLHAYRTLQTSNIENHLTYRCVSGGTDSLFSITKHKLGHLRLVADLSKSEVGDKVGSGISVDFNGTAVSAHTVELSGFENVTRIQEAMFYKFKNMVKIDLSPLVNVTEIGVSFLSKCDCLLSVDLSPFKNVATIGDDFLSECCKLAFIDLSVLNCLTSTGDCFIADCKELKAIQLPQNLSTVGGFFLAGCDSLEEIDLSPFRGSLSSAGAYFMSRCNSLRSVDLSPLSSITSVGVHFLHNCTSLRNLIITPIKRVLRRAAVQKAEDDESYDSENNGEDCKIDLDDWNDIDCYSKESDSEF